MILDTIRPIVGFVSEAIMLVLALLVCIGLIGGRRGLRNPWVYVPLLSSGGLFLLTAYRMYQLDHFPEDASRTPLNWLGHNATLVLLLTILLLPMVSVLAGARRGIKIDRLIHLADMGLDPEEALDDIKQYSHDVRLRAENLVTLEDLKALRPIVRQMGAAPGYDWLTAEWIEARAKALGPSSTLIGPAHPTSETPGVASRLTRLPDGPG